MNELSVGDTVDSLIKSALWLLIVNKSDVSDKEVMKCVIAKSLSKEFSGDIAKELMSVYNYGIYIKSLESKGSRINKGAIFKKLVDGRVAKTGDDIVRIVNRFKTNDGLPSFGSMLNWFGLITDLMYGWTLPNNFSWKAFELLFDEMDVDFEISEISSIMDGKLPIRDLFIEPICDYNRSISFYGGRYKCLLGQRFGIKLVYDEREFTEDFLVKTVEVALHNKINFDHDDHCHVLADKHDRYATMFESVINHHGCTCRFRDNLPVLYAIGSMVYNTEDIRSDSTITIHDLTVTPKILADQIKKEIKNMMN